MKNVLNATAHFIGLGSNQTGNAEKIVAGLGGFAGIALILYISEVFVGPHDAGLIVASMGASAVLLFGVPHGPLSQPWNLVCGHFVSAIIGVSCYLVVPNLFIAAALAVGLAITAMYYLRCIHPPGGATALTAVLAGAGVHSLGYMYILTPVMLNVAVILAVALIFNFPFRWRRYPAAAMQYGRARKAHGGRQRAESGLSRTDLEHALRQLNLFVDISHEDLEKIYTLARTRTDGELSRDQIKLGRYYSNGEYGDKWCIRQVIDESGDERPERDQVIYKVVAGRGRRGTGTVSREAFAQWAKYEVYLNENSWQRVPPQGRNNPYSQAA
jgi:CBS-domain-containing membrane protein